MRSPVRARRTLAESRYRQIPRRTTSFAVHGRAARTSVRRARGPSRRRNPAAACSRPTRPWPGSGILRGTRHSRPRSASRVQLRRGANERRQRLLVDFVALVEVDGPSGVAVEARVEQARRILWRGALGEGHLDHALVRLTGADHPVVIPNRDTPPLPVLDHIGFGVLDEFSDAGEYLAAPIPQLFDPGVDQRGGRLPRFLFLRAVSRLCHGRGCLLFGCSQGIVSAILPTCSAARITPSASSILSQSKTWLI